MSRGDSKISKQIFWINQEKPKSDVYTIDKDPENIFDDQNGKGMMFFKEYKAKADLMFKSYYHQIYTFEKTV
tara:strand:+ start:124 stop:339 length:216 start_codon:yes stop_codon:yes gene_type:complete